MTIHPSVFPILTTLISVCFITSCKGSLLKTPPAIDAATPSSQQKIKKQIIKGYSAEDRQSFGEPLAYAVSINSLEKAQRLLNAGADVNALNPVKKTPLELAINKNSVAMVRLLLKYGARPNYLKKPVSCNVITATAAGGNAQFFEMPLDSAKKNGNATIISLLKQAGAKSASCANKASSLTKVKTKTAGKQRALATSKSLAYKTMMSTYYFPLAKKEFNERTKEVVVAVPTGMRQLVLQYEKSQPTPHSPTASQLARCGLMAARMELDAIRTSHEWLITTKGGGYCGLPKPSKGKPKTFWIVQQKAGNKPVVFASGRAHSVSVLKKDNKTDRIRDIRATVEDGKEGTLEYIRCSKKLKKLGGTYVFTDETAERYIFYPMANTTLPKSIDMDKGSPCLK
jgi:hypothetical protein